MLESSTQPFSAATSSCAQEDDDDPAAADDNVLVLLLLLEKEGCFFKNRFQDQPPQHTFSTDHSAGISGGQHKEWRVSGLIVERLRVGAITLARLRRNRSC